MARRLVDVIERHQGTQHDGGRARVALLAALLHDVGHGPFSHAFESAAEAMGLTKRHEAWSAEIVVGDTEINRVLRDVDEQLPKQVAALLKEEESQDIYSAVVASQFDADRIDYIQRDRLMTGVQFGHVDSDWLLDCLEVGSVTIGRQDYVVGRQDYVQVPCLYLGSKGVAVAEEYLEARFRLYWTVYTHKTTRAAEKMLEALLGLAAAKLCDSDLARREPILRHFTSGARSLDTYVHLDDSTVWAALAEYADCRVPDVSELAVRLRDRHLYKCLEVGSWDEPLGNLYQRFRRKVEELDVEWRDELLFDQSTIDPYTWYAFDDASALSKVLVKSRPDMIEPKDIAEESPIVKALRDQKGRVQRVYAPDSERVAELDSILREVRT